MRFRHILECLFIYPAYYGFRLLPFNWASAFGGFIGRYIGYPLSVTHRARKNLQLALPELSAKEHEVILKGMWENLGRLVGEFPHIPYLTGKRFTHHVEVIGKEHMDAATEAGKGFIFFSGHLSNWELGPLAASEFGHPVRLIYRPANNPYVDKLIRKSRRNSHDGLLPKGKEGARGLWEQLKMHKGVGMLVDQKMNEGIEVPFFGQPAMTAPAMAEFARKFDVPMLPARVERLRGSHFRLTIYPPITANDAKPEVVMTNVNQILESWIRARPEQWFWLHRRWGK